MFKNVMASVVILGSLATQAIAADKNSAVTSFFGAPVCYLEATDSEFTDPQGQAVKDIILVELVYLPHVKALLGVFDYLPAEVDQTVGILDSFSYELMAGARERYLLKTMYHYNVEGESNISEQYFIATKDRIFIGTGERKYNEFNRTYTFVTPDALDYSKSIPRIDCATPTN